MQVFIWQNVDICSDNYHSNGGVVVFAKDEARARQLANTEAGCAIRDDEQLTEARKCSGRLERVFIMPNAGCC